MSKRPSLTPLIESLPATVPFVGPEALEWRRGGLPFRTRLGANENGFGPSARVVEAMRNAAPDVWMYGDPENHELKTAIARHLGVAFENVAAGEGVDALLGLIVRQYVEPGTPVVVSLGGYPTFNFHVTGFGGRLVPVPYDGYRENLEGLLDAVRRENAPLVYLANPDNPMASWWDAGSISAFIEALPETTMLILDEAYCEFAPADSVPPIDVNRPNVLRLRTFSKAYGLAGMRCGYVFGHAAAIEPFDRIRNHFGITRLTQIAALAALEDQEYLRDTVARVAAGRERIGRIAAANGLTALPSATNFVAVDCGADGAFALRVLQELGKRDVFVRKPMAAGQDQYIRVSVGPDSALDLFAEALPEALKAAREG